MIRTAQSNWPRDWQLTGKRDLFLSGLGVTSRPSPATETGKKAGICSKRSLRDYTSSSERSRPKSGGLGNQLLRGADLSPILIPLALLQEGLYIVM